MPKPARRPQRQTKHLKGDQPAAAAQTGPPAASPAGFVVLPTSDYERLLLGKMVRESERVLDGSKAADWSDADDVLAQIASSRIAEFRRMRGLSQRDLGRRLGMPQSQLSRIERNPDSTTLRVLKRIAGALGVRVADLV